MYCHHDEVVGSKLQKVPSNGSVPVLPEISYPATIMQPTVRNDDVNHRPLEIVLPFHGLVTAPIATQDYPYQGTNACANDFAVQ